MLILLLELEIRIILRSLRIKNLDFVIYDINKYIIVTQYKGDARPMLDHIYTSIFRAYKAEFLDS